MTRLPAARSLTLHDLASYSVPGLFSIRIQGLEALPKGGPLLLLANPCSLLDQMLLNLAAGRAVQMGAVSPLFWIPPLRDLASRLNTVPLLPEGVTFTGKAQSYAKAMEQGNAVALFAEHLLERRDEGPRYTFPPGFLEVLLATESERIPVVPVRCHGEGRRLNLHGNFLLAPFIDTASQVLDTPYPPVVFANNTMRLGRPVYWRDGKGGSTLQSFRREVEDSLGALF